MELGIYVLADDKYFDWAVAFLNTFRAYNPTLPLVVIPFSDNCLLLKGISKKYQFEISQDQRLSELDELGSSLLSAGLDPCKTHLWRKFACFWGPFENFFYIDPDVLVLSDLQPLLAEFVSCGEDFLFAHEHMSMVYYPGKFCEMMKTKYKARGFNNGVWAGKRNTLTLDDLKSLASEAQSVKEFFNQSTPEQPFANYCIHRKKFTTYKY